MILAIFSDTHDNTPAIRDALRIAKRRGAETVLHCGDLTSPSTLELFRGWSVRLAYGNMDRNYESIRTALRRIGNASSAGPEVQLNADGLRIAALHGDHPALLQEYIRLGMHDFLFHGHTHRRRDERIGCMRVINPGALGASALESRSFCLLDTIRRELEFIELENACLSQE